MGTPLFDSSYTQKGQIAPRKALDCANKKPSFRDAGETKRVPLKCNSSPRLLGDKERLPIIREIIGGIQTEWIDFRRGTEKEKCTKSHKT